MVRDRAIRSLLSALLILSHLVLTAGPMEAWATPPAPPAKSMPEQVRESTAPARTPDAHLAALTFERTLDETEGVLSEIHRKASSGGDTDDEVGLLEPQEREILEGATRLSRALDDVESSLRAMGGVGVSRAARVAPIRAKLDAGVRALQAAFADLKASPGASRRAEKALRALQDLRSRRSRPGRIIAANQALPNEPLTPVTRFVQAQDVKGGGEVSISIAPPGPADLAPTLDAPFTTDITALAASLGGSPIAVYEHVRDNFTFVPYFGSQKGAAAALESRRGNDWDLASLLIALLRSSAIPCRYVRGTVEIPASDVASWVGARDPNAANPILNTAGISALGIVDGSGNVLSYRIDHVWVEAWVPYASYRGASSSTEGKAWVMLDPSFKRHTRQSGIAGMLGTVPFDEAGYLAQRRTTLPFEHYRQQVADYLRTSLPGRGIEDVPFEGPIEPEPTGLLPATLPYEIVSIASEFSTIADALRHKVTITLNGFSGTLLTQTITLPADVLKRMTVTWVPATPADQAIVDSYGGLENTPAFAVDVKPLLKLDGSLLATGSAVPLADGVSISVSLIYPNSGVVATLTHPYISAGDFLAVGLDADQISDARLDRISAGIMAALPAEGTPSEDEDAVKGAFLHFAGMSYFMELARGQNEIDGLTSYRTVRQVYEGLASSTLQISHIFDLPFFAVPGNLTIDVQRQTAGHLNIDSSSAQNAAHRRLSGDNGSAQEHRTWETLVALEGISTIKSLMLAHERGVPVFVINSGNCPTLCPQLNLHPSVESDIQSKVAAGATVTTPRDETPLNQWHGVGYLVEEPGGAAAYLISGFLAGGETTGPQATAKGGSITIVLDDGTVVVLTPGADGNWLATFFGDPVNAVNGNLYHSESDLSIVSQGMPIAFTRTYNAQSTLSRDMGYGWTHSYGDFLTEDPNGNALWIDEAGNPFFFVKTGSTFTSPAGLHASLTKTSSFTLVTKDRTTRSFDLSGRLTSVADRNGNTHTVSRDGTGRISTVADELGRAVTFGYDGSNRITSIGDFTGRTWSYTYDPNGNLDSFTTPSDANTPAGTWSYDYYSNAFNDHNLKTVTDPLTHVRTFRYYSNDKIFEQTDASGYGEFYLYAPFFGQTMIVGRRGDRTVYTYDAGGNLVSLLDAEGGLKRFTYDADRNRLSRRDARGYLTSFTYDAAGNLLTIDDPVNATNMVMTYDPNTDRVATVTDNRGKVSSYTYDAAGNRLTEIDPNNRTTIVTYDGSGNMLTRTDRRGKLTTLVPNALGLVDEQHDPVGNVHTYEYDPLGRLTAHNRPGSTRTEFAYDVRDRQVELREPGGVVTKYTYDTAGQRTTVIDPMTRVTSFTYDARGLLATTSVPGGGTTVQTYDAGENLVDLQTPRGYHWRFAYDLRGKMTRQIDPAGRVTRMSYDASSNLVRMETPDGAVRTTTYDPLDRVDRADYSDGTFADFSYDASGNILTAVNEATTQTFTYDDRNDIATFADSLTGKSIAYSYDENQSLKTISGPASGTSTSTYDDAGRMTGLNDFGGLNTTFGYDGLDRRSTLSLPNGLATTYTYDPVGRMSGLTTRDAANHVIVTQGLTRNLRGEITAIADEMGPHAYGHDLRGRVTSATHPTLPAESYTYDAAGNRLTSAVGPHAYDETDRIVSAGASVFEHDAAGRITKRTDLSGVTRYTYDAQGRLRRADLPSGGYVAYRYDAYGKKIERDLDGTITRYVYDRHALAAEYDGAGSLLRRYVNGLGLDEPLALVEGSVRTYLSADQIGSIVALTDAAGGVVGRVTYSAFGQPAFSPVVASNPFAFTGRIYDRSTGLYDLRARFYDPTLGRFLQPDPEGHSGGINLYAYAENDPLFYTDPSGRVIPILALALIGGVIGAVANVAATYVSTPSGQLTGNWWLGPAAQGFAAGSIGTIGGALVATGVGALGVGALGSAVAGGVTQGVVGQFTSDLMNPVTGRPISFDPWNYVASAGLGGLGGGVAARFPGVQYVGFNPSTDFVPWRFGRYFGPNSWRGLGQEVVTDLLQGGGQSLVAYLRSLK